ncbi:lysM domain receptor-like kinase 3 [Fagus crenata]
MYEFVEGASLKDCLWNPKNPNFTVLSNWLKRMQIATDLAHDLDYVHHCTGIRSSGFIHNHIKCSSIIITEETLNAKICHFGTAELCGEIADNNKKNSSTSAEPSSSSSTAKPKEVKLEGKRGYIASEFQLTGIETHKSDMYAFSVVVLELLSGEEGLKFLFDKGNGGGYKRVSVIDTAREASEESGGGGVRKWVIGY